MRTVTRWPKLWLLLLSLVALAACNGSSTSTVPLSVNGHRFDVEVADTVESRTAGLSGREALADNAGMLFVFPREEVATFWMKEMRFSLDLIWISADRRIVAITRDAPPQAGVPDERLTLYFPPSPVQFVLEVRGGTATKYGLREGQTVVFSLPKR